MNEDDAKTKWCPHARFADCGADNASSVNRDGMWSVSIKDRCIASDCMMWVSTDNEFMPAASCNPHDNEPSYPAGHCGLVNG